MKMDERKKELKNEKKKFTILGISIWKILTYFIIYSVAGYIIETLFGIATKGTWESRQSFLYGPFCCIYGLGAVVMIIFLQYFNKNNNTLFWGGFLVGSITEYLISFFGEKIFHVIWWDYSNMPLNINGRICFFFSLFWGFLAIYFMSYVNPRIDRILEWFKKKIPVSYLKTIVAIIIVLLLLDFLVSSFAMGMFYLRMIHEHNIPVENKDKMEEMYEKAYQNESLSKFVRTVFSDRKMIRTFPNLKANDPEGNILYFSNYLPEIQPYYYKFKITLKEGLEDVLKGVER